jgi:outer membrane protein TolC
MCKHFISLTVVSTAFLLTNGCTIHPEGEQAERAAATAAGGAFRNAQSQRPAPPLPDHLSADDLVRYALLNNAGLEQRYWEWRAAIEQIPQDGTQATNFAISANTTISRGELARDRTTLTALNDPMTDIVWPQKLSVAARRALQNAHAIGLRFQQAKFDLRNKVLGAYYDYVLIAESIRLEQHNAQLLQTTLTVVDARNGVGAAGQQDSLKARNELDLSRNEIANMQSQLPALRAELNALLNRDVGSSLSLSTELPPAGKIASSDEQLLALAAKQNPELAAMASEIRGKNDSIQLAKLQYLPDFSLGAGTDLAGLTQSLAGMITVPLLRHEAIDAAIAQAQANLKSAEAMRRQTQNDLSAQLILDISTLRDADRQLDLFERTILPRAQQEVTLTRSAYEAGQATLLDLLDSQRLLISLQRLVVNLHITRAKRMVDAETIAGMSLDGPANLLH